MFGEVFICQFPFTSGTGGKIRPALVLFDLTRLVTAEKTIFMRRLGVLSAADSAAVRNAWNIQMQL